MGKIQGYLTQGLPIVLSLAFFPYSYLFYLFSSLFFLFSFVPSLLCSSFFIFFVLFSSCSRFSHTLSVYRNFILLPPIFFYHLPVCNIELNVMWNYFWREISRQRKKNISLWVAFCYKYFSLYSRKHELSVFLYRVPCK